MDEFDKKVSIADPMDSQPESAASSSTLDLLRRFLSVQQRRAEAQVFSESMESGGELAYQQLCSSVTVEFNDCSKQVIEMEAQLRSPNLCHVDLAQLLRAVQIQEKEKLQLTATIQVLKKAGHPLERRVSHENYRFKMQTGHQCMHLHEITEAVEQKRPKPSTTTPLCSVCFRDSWKQHKTTNFYISRYTHKSLQIPLNLLALIRFCTKILPSKYILKEVQ